MDQLPLCGAIKRWGQYEYYSVGVRGYVPGVYGYRPRQIAVLEPG